MSDKKYYWSVVTLGDDPGQILIVHGDKNDFNGIALVLPDGRIRSLPPNANIQIIREILPEAMKEIKEKLIRCKYADIHGITNF